MDNELLTGLSIEQASDRIRDSISVLSDHETVSIDDAYGRIASEDIYAPDDVPRFARSAMDGYAVRSSETRGASRDTPVKLKVADELVAGDFSDRTYDAGTAVRIMTGAVVPSGFDSVIMQEDTDYGEEQVCIFKEIGSGINISPPGEEFHKGDQVISGHTRIGRIETGLMASTGISRVRVYRKIRVAVIITGSELDEPGSELHPGHIYSNLPYMLGASLQDPAFVISYRKTAGDDREQILREIAYASEISDIVITTGGVSVGKKDLMHEALDALGTEKLFYRVDIQPGTPTIGSMLDGRFILSLSGNPYAALANFDIYFAAAAAAFTGCRSLEQRTATAVLQDPYDKVNKHRRLIRAYEEAGRVYLTASSHRSSVFGNLTACNCYIDIPGGTAIAVGKNVNIRYML